jgi:hypothetical protein
MKYRIIKEGLNLKGSQIGDIVDMNDGAATIALKAEVVELCDQFLPNKHVLMLVDPLQINLSVKK